MQPTGSGQLRGGKDLCQPLGFGLSRAGDAYVLVMTDRIQLDTNFLQIAAETFNRFEPQVACGADGSCGQRSSVHGTQLSERGPHTLHAMELLRLIKPFQVMAAGDGDFIQINEHRPRVRWQVGGEMILIAAARCQNRDVNFIHRARTPL